MALQEQLWGVMGGSLFGDGRIVETEDSQVFQGILLQKKSGELGE